MKNNPYVEEAKYDTQPGGESGAQYSMSAAFPMKTLLEQIQYTPRRRSLYEEQRVSYVA